MTEQSNNNNNVPVAETAAVAPVAAKPADADKAALTPTSADSNANDTAPQAGKTTQGEADADAAAAPKPQADESWYGKAPDEAITKVVKDKLGSEVADLYVRACRQLDGAKDDVQRILEATNTFVTALNKVPEDQQMTVAFGEMSLAHGRALVRYIELEGSGSSAIAAKLVKAIQSAVTAGSGGGAEVEDEEEEEEEGEKQKETEKKEEEKEKSGEKEDDAVEKVEKKEKDKDEKKEDEEDEDDSGDNENEDLENAWTQLEVARVIFTREGLDAREAECRYTLGKLLMACDDGKQSATEFASAAILYAKIGNKRLAAECHYQHFLAIRNADRPQAAQALRDAVALMQGVSGTDDVLEEMKTDLKDFEATIDDEEKAKKVTVPTEVQVVRPKRKRDVAAAAASETPQLNGQPPETSAAAANGTANGNANGSAAAEHSNGAVVKTEQEKKPEETKAEANDGTEEKQAKKARVEPNENNKETQAAVPEKAAA